MSSAGSAETRRRTSFRWERVPGAGAVVYVPEGSEQGGLLKRPGLWFVRAGSWLVAKASSLVPAVGLIGAIVYGILWLAYSHFYEGLGLRPEDVGLSYADILSRSVSGMVLATFVTLYYMFFDSLSLIAPSLMIGALCTLGAIGGHFLVRRLLSSSKFRHTDTFVTFVFMLSTLLTYSVMGLPRALTLTLPAEADSLLCRLAIWASGLVLLLASAGRFIQYASLASAARSVTSEHWLLRTLKRTKRLSQTFVMPTAACPLTRFDPSGR
jgi:hypothetical protein